MRYWVDITTGTYGPISDIRVIDVDDVEAFEQMTDSKRAQFARTTRVVPLGR